MTQPRPRLPSPLAPWRGLRRGLRLLVSRLPGAAAARKGPFVGALDGLQGGVATGWAWDPLRPGHPPTVEFLVDGRVLRRVRAELPREDVAAAGYGDGRAGFFAELPPDLFARGAVEVRARLAGSNWELSGSPRTERLGADWQRRLARGDRVRGAFRAWLARRLARAVAGRVLSLVVPVHDTPPDWLRECLDSVLAQWCPAWELVCVDDASANPETRAVLADYAARDPRIRCLRNETNLGIARSVNRGIAAAAGTHIAFLDHDDALEPDAVFHLLRAAGPVRGLGAGLVYADEVLTGPDLSQLIRPQLRPAWSWDYYLCHPYFVHPVCVEAGLARAVGGWDEGMDISGDVDFVLRVAERAERIAHVPAILYRWRTHESSTGHRMAERVEAATVVALDRHLARLSPGAKASATGLFNYYRADFPDPGGRVLAVIPTRDRLDLLRPCIESLRATARPDDLDILVVDHLSQDPATRAWLAAPPPGVAVLRVEGPFNYAAINNAAVAHARARPGELPPFLLFANNDIEAREPGWLERMRALAGRPEVGAVGATLLYPGGTVQHSGVLAGVNGPAEHAHKFVPFRDRSGARRPGPLGGLVATRDYSAVTAACLMLRSEVFERVGGFDARFAVGFNDTDLCLRIREAGLSVLNDAQSVLLHRESATRRAGDLKHPADTALFRERWAALLAEGDPFYSPLMGREGLDHQAARLGVNFPRARLRPGPSAGRIVA